MRELDEKVQTVDQMKKTSKKKALIIAVVAIFAVIAIAGAAVGVTAYRQAKFEKQIISLIQDGDYQKAAANISEKKCSERQKDTLTGAFTEALTANKIKIPRDISEKKLQDYQHLKQLGEALSVSVSEPSMQYVIGVLKLEKYCEDAVLWRLALGEELKELDSIASKVTTTLNSVTSFYALLPELSSLREKTDAVDLSSYDKENDWVAEASVSKIILYGGLSNMCDAILQNSQALFSKGQEKVTDSMEIRIKILEKAQATMTPAVKEIHALPAF